MAEINIQTAPPQAVEVNLQQHLEQIEAAIAEAHKAVSRFTNVPPGAQGQSAESGAVAAANRCQSELQNLIGRINAIADRVGEL